jgi:hypothetical protein
MLDDRTLVENDAGQIGNIELVNSLVIGDADTI